MSNRDTEPVSSRNRRRFSRVDFHHELVLKNNKGVDFQGAFSDVSLKGMFFQGDALPAKGDTVFGVLQLGDVSMQVQGVVVHSEKDHGAAILFQDMDVESFSHLRRLVSLNLGDSETIDREFFSSL